MTNMSASYIWTGWWFGCHFLFSHILGMSSSQLTFIFFGGVAQPPTSLGVYVYNINVSLLAPWTSRKRGEKSSRHRPSGNYTKSFNDNQRARSNAWGILGSLEKSMIYFLRISCQDILNYGWIVVISELVLDNNCQTTCFTDTILKHLHPEKNWTFDLTNKLNI